MVKQKILFLVYITYNSRRRSMKFMKFNNITL